MKLKFTVNRKRSDWDGERDLVECVIERPEEFCKKVDCCGDEFDEPAYDRFTREVPRIVWALTGLDCSPDWYFDLSPEIVKEV